MISKVGEAALEEVIIGRKALQSIGCDNKGILAAACDENDGVISIPKVLSEDTKKREALNDGLICALTQRGVFHSHASEGNDGLENAEVYTNLGDDEPEVIDRALQWGMEEAREKCMSAEGVEELISLIEEFKPIFD
ncbi:unnamed protein product [Agarophyton chilense]|eukprot:gb/GEZJ01004091.1/.p4 GENE.gb/GEZJ01004091.1/~~gb/GEZJ01004091.1/.p4  ORF type:complete len:137 (+),score=29.55 gb/GEZJ01004091.1/:1544-1954(+)